MNEPKAAPGIAPKCSCWIGRGDYGGLAPDRIACAVHGDEALAAAKLAAPGIAPREPLAPAWLQNAERALQEVVMDHRDVGSSGYNECEKDQCAWCDDAEIALAGIRQAKLGAAEQEIRTLRTQLEELRKLYNDIVDIDLARRQLPDGSVPGNTVDCARGWFAAYWKLLASWTESRERHLKAEAEIARLMDEYWQRPKVQELVAETARLRTQLEKYESRRPDGDGPDSHSVFNGAYPVEGSGSNPDDSLSLDDLRAHYAAALANWDECLRQLKIAEQDAVALRATLIALRDKWLGQKKGWLGAQPNYSKSQVFSECADALTQAAGLPQ